MQDCSDYKYEYNNLCYPYCPEGVDFCSPEDERLLSTNIFFNNISEEISTNFSINLT